MELTVAELVASAVEVEEAAEAAVESVDAVGADVVACVRMTVAACIPVAASHSPSAETGGLGAGDGCVGAVVGGNVGDEALGMTRLSAD